MVPVAIIIPLLNDWSSAKLLLQQVDQVFRMAAGDMAQYELNVYLVDDGSTEECPVEAFAGPFQFLNTVNLLPLKINVGHQRAIACGLVYLGEQKNIPDMVIIMDGDGEDRPQDMITLLKRFT